MFLLNSLFHYLVVICASKVVAFRFQVLPMDELRSDVVVTTFSQESNIKLGLLYFIVQLL